MGATTTRLVIPYPTASDPNDVPGDLQRLAKRLDDIGVAWTDGTLAARPTAGVKGRAYIATDGPTVYWDTGSVWVALNLAATVTAKGDLLVASGNAALARLGVGSDGQVLQANSAAGNGVGWGSVLGLPLGLSGAGQATRYVGGTTSGPPTSGSFLKGDYVCAQNGIFWTCVVAGSPGSWTPSYAPALGLPLGLTGATGPTRYVGGVAAGLSAPASGTFAAGDFAPSADGSLLICTVGGSPGTWVRIPGLAPVCEVRLTANANIPAATDTFAQAGWAAYDDAWSMFTPGSSGNPSYMTVPGGWGGRYSLRYHSTTSGVGTNGSNAVKICVGAADINNNSIATANNTVPGTGGDGAVVDCVTEIRLSPGQRIFWANFFSVAGTLPVSVFNVPTAIEMRWESAN